MLVKEAYQVLYALMADEHGDKELIAIDTRSGCTSSVSIYSGVTEVRKDEDCGTLCDREMGLEYVPVYLDH
jgi:hypothetical protein